MSQRLWTIYLLSNNITGRQYIGLTVSGLRRRWAQHIWHANSPQSKSFDYPLARAIRKHGETAFSMTRIAVADTLEQAQKAEQLAIVLYHTIAPAGYNQTLGGEGTLGRRRPHSPATRAKISAAHRGRKRSAAHQRALSDSYKGRIISPAHRAQISATQKGRLKPPGHGLKVAAANRLRPITASSGYRGVYRVGKRWIARLTIGPRTQIHLGSFATPEDANNAIETAKQALSYPYPA